MKEQSSEGWWSEYGGPDAGYLSLMLDYLARYHALLPREDLNHALTRATHFLLHFTHPNGTFGGEYLSRNTEYLIPSGIALRSAEEGARMLYSFAAEALQKRAGVTPHSLDDRYLCYILYNWVVAGLAGVIPLPDTIQKLSGRRFDVFFEEAGIWVVQNDVYYFVANLRKGGSFRLYGKEGWYADSGTEMTLNGKWFGISGLRKGKVVKETASYFLSPIREPLLKTARMLLFKGTLLCAGALPFFKKGLKKALRARMIMGTEGGIMAVRSFRLESRSLTVIDEIDRPLDREMVRLGTKASYAFIPSAKYATREEILGRLLIPTEQTARSEKNIGITRTFTFGN